MASGCVEGFSDLDAVRVKSTMTMSMNSEIIWTRCLVASFARRRAAGASGPDACPVRVRIRGAPPGVFPF